MEYSFQRLCFIFVVCVYLCQFRGYNAQCIFFYFFFALTALFDIA